MAIRTILTQGDSALSKICHPVTRFDDRLADLLDDLKETLEEAGGMGLAAPQVGTSAGRPLWYWKMRAWWS